MTLWLLIGLLLLPTLLAIPARVLTRRGGARGATLVAGAGFAGCVACALALGWLPLDTEALGRLGIFVPSTDVVARESVPESQREPAAEPSAIAAVVQATREPTAAPEPTAVPEPTATAVRTPLPEPTPEPTPEPISVPEPTPEPISVPEPRAQPTSVPEPRAQPRRYVVEPGDTLWKIAALYAIDPDELQRYNGLTDQQSRNLQIDQVLFIPPR